MGKEIRTKEVHRDIRILDRAETMARYLKENCIQMKEKKENNWQQEENNGTSYAQRRIEQTATRGRALEFSSMMAKKVNTIEGNTSNMVARRSYQLGGIVIVGYGYI